MKRHEFRGDAFTERQLTEYANGWHVVVVRSWILYEWSIDHHEFPWRVGWSLTLRGARRAGQRAIARAIARETSRLRKYEYRRRNPKPHL